MKNISFRQRLRYRFDNLMSKGPIAMIALLAIMSLVVVVAAGVILSLFQIAPEGSEPMNFVEGAWQSLMRTLDSGTMGGDAGWGFRIVAFIVTLGGIFIISTLIGVLSSGIEGKLDELRKGKSFVIEKNHILILGWSSKIFTIISELIIANENKKNPRIVILADMDKVDMEDEIRSKVPHFKNTRIICRSGIPYDLVDLAIANPLESKSIIVLAPDSGNTDPLVIKTILAITNNPNRRVEPYHIVAEIRDRKNLEVARMVGKDEVELVLTDDIIGRIIVQTSRQSGLSIVFTELLDFNGAEIYFKHEKKLVGKTFGEAIFQYEDSAVIGLQFNSGQVKINPPMDYLLQEGDQVIAITEDDDTLVTANESTYVINEDGIMNLDSKQIEPERILLLGWNKRATIIINEMDNYVGPKSYMKVVAHFDHMQEAILALAKSLNNIQLEFQCDDTTSRSVIDGLDITTFNSVQLLSYKDDMDIEEADAQTLISLLHIRSITEKTGIDLKIVSEMLSLRNRELAEVTKADDFIVSDNLISLLVSQISENKYLMRVFEDLFSATGSEIYLKPISDYIQIGQQVNFYTVLESARRQGQTAIGYRISSWAHDNQKAYGIVLNPAKSKEIQFEKDDRIIVLAEE
ncbi:MAG: potassium transporter TrkA [Saprospiraceae bacterium]|jgi:ion channel POLLUX/CASTOR|nr:potassium transporter TrkA [Saprospiraceae bacterium]